MNKLVLIGNVGNQPDYFAFENGGLLTKFPIAVTRYNYKTKENDTDWFDVETYSKLGEYIKKGHKVAVEGSIITNVWINKDGKKIKNYIVKASSVEILTKKEDTEPERYGETEIIEDIEF